MLFKDNGIVQWKAVYRLSDLKADWEQFRKEDPENHAPDFKTELLEIMMATINGRNDLEIIGMTPNEVVRYIMKLRNKIGLI